MRSNAATHLDFEPQAEEITDERQALRRASAELEAARARVERDAERIHDETRTRLVAELLPVLDNLDRAIAAGDGVRLVREQLAGVLRGYGLERFDAAGARFDPREHEAMSMVPVDSPAADGTVVEQWQPGYRIGGRLLRPARVSVGRYRQRF
jgi:molecular chaperone GrpE (heat shock protein)